MEYLQYLQVRIGIICDSKVLNLIINGIPSILNDLKWMEDEAEVLNLIINGIPSIL